MDCSSCGSEVDAEDVRVSVTPIEDGDDWTLVPYDRAVLDERHRPVRRRCSVDEYDAAGWLK